MILYNLYNIKLLLKKPMVNLDHPEKVHFICQKVVLIKLLRKE